MLVMNFHACKGCERPIVIALGIDEEYFKYYASNFKPTEHEPIPNVINVALTRASKKLIIISSQNTLRTIIPNRLKEHVVMGSALEMTDNTALVKESLNVDIAELYQKRFEIKTTEYVDMLSHPKFMTNVGTSSSIPLYIYELMLFVILNDRQYKYDIIDLETAERALDDAIRMYRDQSENKHKEFDFDFEDIDIGLIKPVVEAIRTRISGFGDGISRPIVIKLADNIDTNGYKKLAKLYGEDFSIMLYGQRRFFRVLINSN
jgi:hypothetical protein